TVNAVAPGFTLTRFWDKTSKDEEKELLDSTLLKKWVAPEDIAEAFIYLAKNDSVTGQTLVVDAGYTATL
ncbi:SDR family oxidoreductase, partial [Candidatus Microgenomates bacterium]|nr:SDR family oxidoreductase [Candidatus Microgenomates bacterium]